MANLQKVRQRRIERKYEKLIGKTLKEMKDATMSELWAKLDEIKLQMAEEFKTKNVEIELEHK